MDSLPRGFVMPQVLIAVDKLMVDPAISRQNKRWPPFEDMRNAKLESLKDHPWFRLREVEDRNDGEPQAGTSQRLDKGKGREDEVGDGTTVATDANAEVTTDNVERGQQRKRRQSRPPRAKSRVRAKSVKSAPTIDGDGDHPTPTTTSDAPPADWEPTPQDERCDRCVRADIDCMVKSGRACKRCHDAKARCSRMGGIRARSRAASRAPRSRRATSPANTEASPSRPAKRRRATSTRPATPGPSQASSSRAKSRSKFLYFHPHPHHFPFE